MPIPLEFHRTRFPEDIPLDLPTQETSVFQNPRVVQSTEFIARMMSPKPNLNIRNILRELRKFWEDPESRLVFRETVEGMKNDATQAADTFRVGRYDQVIKELDATHPIPKEFVDDASIHTGDRFGRYLKVWDEKHGDSDPSKTIIIPMPEHWLSAEERAASRRSNYSAGSLRKLDEARQFNEWACSEADVVMIDLRILPGFLGDAIQDSRLVGILAGRYPDKVIVTTNHPNFLGRYPVSMGFGGALLEPKVRFKRSYESPVEEKPDLATFLVSPKIDKLGSGKFITPGGFQEKQGLGSQDLNEVEEQNIVHTAQVNWEALWGVSTDQLPDPAIRVPNIANQFARGLFDSLSVSDRLNLIIHPDASKGVSEALFLAKRWGASNWAELARTLVTQFGNLAIFVSTGSDHPEETEQIVQTLSGDRSIPVFQIPKVGLAVYTALVDQFSRENTIFLGSESMPGSHLAPSLGFRSIVLSHTQMYARHYGPWRGLVVANVDEKKGTAAGVHPSKVVEAVDLTIKKLGKDSSSN